VFNALLILLKFMESTLVCSSVCHTLLALAFCAAHSAVADPNCGVWVRGF